MELYKRQFYLALFKAFDLFLITTSLFVSMWFWWSLKNSTVSVTEFLHMKLKLINFLALLIFILFYHVTLNCMGLYDSRRLHAGKGECKDICKSIICGTVILMIITTVFRREYMTRDVLALFAVLACMSSCLGRLSLRAVLGWLRERNHNLRNLLLVGCNKRGQEFVMRLNQAPQLGYRIAGFIDDMPRTGDYLRMGFLVKDMGTLNDLDVVLDTAEVDEVMITLPIQTCYKQIKEIVTACETQGIVVHLLSNFFPLQLARAQASEFEGLPVLTLQAGPVSVFPAYCKRAFDIFASGLLLILLAPILALTAILIKVCSPGGPVFFVQTRIGYNRRQFKMFKFRTMIPQAERLQKEFENLNEAAGPLFKIKNDPRITPIGRFLRKTSIDELPQLLNVLRGDMSLVGPRPLPLRDVAKFEEKWLKRRFSVKPGITCLWQINGRSHSSSGEWIKQDLEYIDHWSFALDLKILLKTIPAVLKGAGAY